MPERQKRVWLITGCSSGFGQELCKYVIEQGDHLVATARRPADIQARGPEILAERLDVTQPDSIEAAFAAALRRFGRVDVVVNNAGFGLCGAFEELSPKKIEDQMAVNFFGALNVTRVALRIMREQQPSGGTILQISSNSGLIGFPCFSAYCASKHALEGATESISKELKPEWNIRLCCIEPGSFRTEWTGRGMVFREKPHPAYDQFHHVEERQKARHGTQPGDAAKGARAIYQLASMDKIPLRACIGSDSQKSITEKVDALRKHFQTEEFMTLAHSCNVDS